ncbi:MAG: hydrogenase nickel incorporation protein HypB [Acetobacteraceae bacterium]|nr:hydrogenase nickel incorporation protein HypB [Acetobacteraceae bacterium]
MPATVKVVLGKSLREANETWAGRVRDKLRTLGTLAVNLMGSPGCGKTTLLCATLQRLRGLAPAMPLYVVEGDPYTTRDAEAVGAQGVPVVQINTRGGCHLDARMVDEALRHLDLKPRGTLFIENIGNLICPGGFDLGEDLRVALLSAPEGNDKPEKYAAMFRRCDAVVLSKMDLCGPTGFDPGLAREAVRRLNPAAAVFSLSARDGTGMGPWTEWLMDRAAAKRSTADPGGV